MVACHVVFGSGLSAIGAALFLVAEWRRLGRWEGAITAPVASPMELGMMFGGMAFMVAGLFA